MASEILLITQARMGSTRLPGKILKEIKGTPLLKIHLDRLSRCRNVSKIIVATTDNFQDDFTAQLVETWGFPIFRGSEHDVLSRFYHAALPFAPERVVRVTADCPLIDPLLVDEIITFAIENQADYASNVLVEHFPDGQDVEVFTFKALETANHSAIKNSEREHVTPYLRNNANDKGEKIFRAVNFPAPDDFSRVRMTVDEPSDFELIKKLIGELGTERSWLEYTEYLLAHDLLKINEGIARNEGMTKSLKEDQL